MESIKKANLIDLHAHVRLNSTDGAAGKYGPESGEDENGMPWYRVGNYRLYGVKHKTSPFTDPNLRIERMKKERIDFQVLSPSPLTYFHFIETKNAVSFCQKHNDACSDLVKKFPEKLGGLASLPMQNINEAVAELKRAVCSLNLWGAAIGTDFPMNLDNEKLDIFYETLVDLNVPLFIHPAPMGIDGPEGDSKLKRFDLDVVVGFASQETIAVSTLIFGGVLERHPKLDVWISHGGGGIPMLAARLAVAARKRPWASQSIRKDGAFEELVRRVWYDCHVTDLNALKLLKKWVDSKKIVYGTNFAGWDHSDSNYHFKPDSSWADNARKLLRKG